MPVVMNHHILDVKACQTKAVLLSLRRGILNSEYFRGPRAEVIKGHTARDGPVHFVPERCTRSTESKSSSIDQPIVTLASSRRNQTLIPTSGKPFSPTSLLQLSSSTTILTTTPASTSILTTTPASTSILTTTPADAQPWPHVKSYNGHGGASSTQTDVNRSPASGTHVSEDSSSSDFETSEVKIVAPASPPTVRGSCLTVSQQTLPLGPSRLSRIRQSHLASKKREQMKLLGTKLPELSENPEFDAASLQSTAASENESHISVSAENAAQEMTEISETDNVSSIAPDVTVTPSMSDSFLAKFELDVQNSSSTDDVSVDQLPEKDIESKFVSLSLAFKTDKLTLDQRVSVQERSRDLAEKNVDNELQGLSDAVENLSEIVAETNVRGVLQKIKQHIDVIEQLTAKVSSRAEVFGAVQQERRMCKAMEVMVLYTDNLRRTREKEESELTEARKLLNDRFGNSLKLNSEPGPCKRSMSVSGLCAIGRPMRRRSEVALPRIIGGVGSPTLSPTANLDPKSRFQSAVASTSMQHVVATTMRRHSQERHRSTSMTLASSSSSPVVPTSSVSQTTSSSKLSVTPEPDNMFEAQGEKLDTGSKISQEEEAFRKGFREGLKAKLSQELNDLRDQQNSISQILEHVMDKVDSTETEDGECISSSSWFETTLALTWKIRDHILQYDWRSNKAAIRNLTGVIFIVLAVVMIFLCPPVSSVKIGHFVKPPQ